MALLPLLNSASIIISLALLMILAYRGYSVFIIAPLMALLAIVISNEGPLLATYTQVFMKALGGYITTYFPLFLLGAIFGKLMETSGIALGLSHHITRSIGKNHTILAIVLACALLTYGGVSLFVVAFSIYPIANALFKELNIPKRLIPASIALGSFTFTMTALPGTPSLQNAIPMPFFHTNTFAAPVLGIIASILMLGVGIAWLNRAYRKAYSQGEGYGVHNHKSSSLSFQEQLELAPSFWRSILPILLVIGLNYYFSQMLFPSLDLSYLSLNLYGSINPKTVIGLWGIISALFISIILICILNFKTIKDLRTTLNEGAYGALTPIFNTANEVGYGVVISGMNGFKVIRDLVLDIGSSNPAISLALAINVLSGITGSASGGMSIALSTIGEYYIGLAQQAGISMEVLHRVAAIASGGLDTLPHNGAVITLLGICGLTHRESYKDIFMVSILGPVIALLTILMIGSYFPL